MGPSGKGSTLKGRTLVLIGPSHQPWLIRPQPSPVLANDPGLRLVAIPLPARLDGSGSCWLGCKACIADYFGLRSLPFPEELVAGRAPGGRVLMTDAGMNANFGGTPYAFGMNTRTPSGSRTRHRFRLSSGHKNETLELIRNHIDRQGINWYGVVTGSGGTISSCFLSRGLVAA